MIAGIDRRSDADAQLGRGGGQGLAHPAAGAIQKDREGHGAEWLPGEIRQRLSEGGKTGRGQLAKRKPDLWRTDPAGGGQR